MSPPKIWIGPPNPPTLHPGSPSSRKRLRRWLGKSYSRQAAPTIRFLHLVLYGILELGKTKLDALCVQRLVQFGECIAGGDVHAGDRLRRNDQPTYRRWRFRHGIQNALLEEFGVGEEEWRVPPKQDQSRDLACIRIT